MRPEPDLQEVEGSLLERGGGVSHLATESGRTYHRPPRLGSCTRRCIRRSDTRVDYTRPGFDGDAALLVVGDVDSHLGAYLGLVGGVGGGQGGGDVLEAGDEGFDVLGG